MSRLRIFEEEHPDAPVTVANAHAEIARAIAPVGVAFEQWESAQPVVAGDAPEAIMAAYKADIDRLVEARGFRTVDVVSIAPDNPKRDADGHPLLHRTGWLGRAFHRQGHRAEIPPL